MTVEKGIEVLEIENKYPWNRDNSELREAVKLGIEALKYIKEWRIPPHGGATILLPGETEK